MNKSVENYQKIVNNLIMKSFPELKNKKVKVVEFPKFFLFWSFAQKSIGGFLIFINRSQRKLSLNSLRGEFSHELCHIILDHKDKSLFGDLIHNFRKFLSFTFNTKFSKNIETKVDKEVVKRGYAKELIANHGNWVEELSEENIKNLYSRGYLNPKKIKSYAQKIKKW